MRKFVLATLLALAAASPAIAGGSHVPNCNPYVVVARCDADMPSCGRAHMIYRPGSGVADRSSGNYLYETPPYESCGKHCRHHGHAAHHRHAAHHKVAHARVHHRPHRARHSPYINAAGGYDCGCGHRHVWWPG